MIKIIQGETFILQYETGYWLHRFGYSSKDIDTVVAMVMEHIKSKKGSK